MVIGAPLPLATRIPNSRAFRCERKSFPERCSLEDCGAHLPDISSSPNHLPHTLLNTTTLNDGGASNSTPSVLHDFCQPARIRSWRMTGGSGRDHSAP